MSILSGIPLLNDKGNPAGYLAQTGGEFFTDARRLVAKCTKPDAKEFFEISRACVIGFLLFGMIGFIVKLVFIPVNNIIVGGH